jgi:hypothetical protein
MISDHDRLIAIERDLARIARRLGEPRYREKRDGREILSVRIGDELAALVRRTARHRGCTIADLLRPAILAAVNHPSTELLTEQPSEAGLHMRPRIAPRYGGNGAGTRLDRPKRDGRLGLMVERLPLRR